MPASAERIQQETRIEPTAQDKGLTLTVQVTAYDNGMATVDGTPINRTPEYEAGQGWLGAVALVAAKLEALPAAGWRAAAVERTRAVTTAAA